jgi:hypothetical protein
MLSLRLVCAGRRDGKAVARCGTVTSDCFCPLPFGVQLAEEGVDRSAIDRVRYAMAALPAGVDALHATGWVSTSSA